MFLSEDDLKELTGYVQLSAQRAWLIAHGWKFETDRRGKPRVLRAEAEGRMLSKPERRSAPKVLRMDKVG